MGKPMSTFTDDLTNKKTFHPGILKSVGDKNF
jgi:hypothetical protein